MNSLNGGALVRSGRFAKAGMSAGGNYLKHYLGNSLPCLLYTSDAADE